ncbi:MAG: RDD family protein [Acidimicrobiia bacterium]|nr:RDD family protein [Acidimicrobiia bacterium]
MDITWRSTDWWRGPNGRWYSPFSRGEDNGHVAPKVTGRRVVAALIDLVPLATLFFGLASRFGELETSGGFSVRLESVPFLLFLGAMVLYFVVAEGLTGTSLGKWIMRLEVTRVDGSRPTWGATLSRNALRILDLLPAFYLVGIVTVWSTSTNQRIGDLAASTVVIPRGASRYPGEAATEAPSVGPDDAVIDAAQAIPTREPRAATRVATVAVIAFATIALGVGLLVAGPPGESLGELSIEDAVDPFVENALEAAFRPLSIDALAARSAPELVELPGFEDAIVAFEDNPGPLIGDYRIVDVTLATWTIPSDGAFPVAEYQIEGEFRDRNSMLFLAVINRAGTLQIVAWNVAFPTPE